MVNDDLLSKIQEMANHDDWRVREAAARQIQDLNQRYFDDYLPVWQEWVRDENHFLRRAAEVGLLNFSNLYYEKAFNLLEPLLYDENQYVRRSCGPLALNAVASLNPEKSLKRFTNLIQQENTNLRWNIAMCLGARLGQEHLDSSLPLLYELAKDRRRFVWRATAASVIQLLRRNPNRKQEVYTWKGVDYALAVIKEYLEWPEADTRPLSKTKRQT
jgi:3-methyladenine DNA glycosylase AlkD